MSKLNELCTFDFQGKALACVIDSLGFGQIYRLELTKSIYYFNAGIMYFNLAYFEKYANYYYQMLDHLKNNIGRYKVNDQDLLNDFFQGNIQKMNPKFNFQGIHYMYPDNAYFDVYREYAYYSPEEIALARENVCIVHFFRIMGKYPWEKGNCHPLCGLYEEWKAKTPWASYKIEATKRSAIFVVEYLLYRTLPPKVFLKLFKYITSSSN